MVSFLPHYWMLPLFGSIIWVGTMVAMLVVWHTSGKPHYDTMCENCTVPYISDIGAGILKPLFIAGSAVTGIAFFLALASERFLRHRGRLVANASRGEKILVGLSIASAILGAVALILLSVFDVRRHNTLHDTFLLLFVVGIMFSALFIIIEGWKLNKKNRDNKRIVHSFYAKCLFVAILVPSAFVFGAFLFRGNQNVAAVVEWCVAFLFAGFIMIFVWDLYPATKTTNGEMLIAEKQAITQERACNL